jgi:hypothetical protein
MPLILAIEPDRRQAAQLKTMVRARLEADLVLAESVDQGLIELGDRIPDLILTSALLSPKDEVALDQRLRALDGTACFVQTLTIPVFATTPEKPKRARGLLSALRREAPVSKSTTHGCDPKIFAEQCAEYLERAQAERVRQAEEAETARAFATPAAEPAHFVFDATPLGFEDLPRDAEPVSYETFAPLPETWRTPVDEYAFRASTEEAAWHAVSPDATDATPSGLEVTAENATSYSEDPPAALVIPLDTVMPVIPVMAADPLIPIMPVMPVMAVIDDTVLLTSPVVDAPHAPPAEPEQPATVLVPGEAETSLDAWPSLAATQDTITAAAIVPVILEIPHVEDTVVITSPVVESVLETLPPETESPAAPPFADEAPASVDEALSIAVSAEAVDVQPVAAAFEAHAADAPRDEPAIAAHEQEFEPAPQIPEGEPIFAMPVVVEEPSAALTTLEAAPVSLPAMVEVEERREPSIETPVETVPAAPVRQRSVPLQLGVRQLWPSLEGVPVDEVDEVDEVALEGVGDALHADSVEIDLTSVTEEASPAADEFELLLTSPAIDDLIEAVAALDAQDTVASESLGQEATPDDSLLDAHLLEPFEDWTADGLTFENDHDAVPMDVNVADVNSIDVNVIDDVKMDVVSVTGSADAAGEPEESAVALDAAEPETAEAQVIVAEVALDAAASVEASEPVAEAPAAPESAVEAKAVEPRTDRNWTSVGNSDDVIDDDFEEEPFEDDPIDMETEAWAPLRIGVHQLWPRLEGGIALSREIAVIETRRPTPIVEPPPSRITASVPRIARPPVTIRRAPAIVATPIVVPPIATSTFESTTPVMASGDSTSARPAEPVMRQEEPIVEARVDVTESPRELRETAIATPPAAIVVSAPENERSAMTVKPPETVETGASPVSVAATASAPVAVMSPTPVSVSPPTPIAVSAPLTPIAITAPPSLVSEAPRALIPPPAVESARPEWLDVIESLKRDVERLQSDRVQPAAPPAPVPPVEVQVHVQAPAAPTASKHVAPAEQKPVDAAGKKRRSRKKKKKKGVQEDWGFFDPEQVGFSALLSKLDEVTNDGPKGAG